MLSDLVVCYLFLGSTGAGLVFVLSALGLLVPRDQVIAANRGHLHAGEPFRRLLGSGFIVALIMLGLGIVCLLADLGNAERAVLLLLHPSVSYLALGSWALAACFVLAALLGLAWLAVGTWDFAVVRGVEAVAALAALVVMVYTGLLLQSLGAVPLWATPWLPALFVASSLSCGMASVLALAQFTGAARAFGTVLKRLAVIDAVVILVEAAMVAVFVFEASTAGATASNGTELAVALSVRDLLGGQHAWLFWSCFVGLGLAVPLVLDGALARRRRMLPGLALFTAACVLAGGFAMRFCVVAAGAHPVLNSMGVM